MDIASLIAGLDMAKLAEMQPVEIPKVEVKTIIQTAKILEVMYNGEMDNETYHNSTTQKFAGVPYAEILSSSKLKAAITPLHYRLACESTTAPNPNLITGTALHSMILEPEKFEYILFDDFDICQKLISEGYKSPRSTKEYKAWVAQYQDADGNFLPNVLNRDTFKSMWKLKKKVVDVPVVRELFKSSSQEHSIFIHFDGGLRVKIRPDAIKLASKKDAENFEKYDVKEGDLLNISVKTTLDASPSGFLKQCIRLGYHLTEAFYYDVLTRWAENMNLLKPNNKVKTIFLTIEKDAKQNFTGAYLVRPATSDFITWGRMDYDLNLTTIRESKTGEEGYESITGSIITEIDKPSWK